MRAQSENSASAKLELASLVMGALACFAPCSEAQVTQLFHQSPASFYWGQSISSNWPSFDQEASDDFEVEGTITEVWMPFETCVSCPMATVLGLRVRFYADGGATPGGLLSTEYVPAGPKLAVSSSQLQATLSTPFVATGRHFISLQIDAPAAHGSGWSVSSPNGPSGARAVRRDNLAGGAWAGVTTSTTSNCDLGFSLLGIAGSAPPLYPDPGGVWESFGPPGPGSANATRFEDVKTFSAQSVWAVGSYTTGPVETPKNHGLLMRYDGSSWNQVSIPVYPIHPQGSVTLEGIDGTSAFDLWVIGSHSGSNLHGGPNSLPLVMHYDGASWQVMTVPASASGVTAVILDDVESASANEVWFAGWGFAGVAVPIVLEWNGAALSAHDLPGASPYDRIARAVTVVGPNEVWVVGGGNVASQGFANAFAARFDGAVWTEYPVPVVGTKRQLHSIAALSSTNVWASGSATKLGGGGQDYDLHFDGSTWTHVNGSHALGSLRRTPLGVLRGTGRFASQFFPTGWHFVEDFGATFGAAFPSIVTVAVDGGADGSLIAVGTAFSGVGPVPVALRRNPDCAARTFAGQTVYPLDLEFVPIASPTSGVVRMQNATPSASGLLIVSSSPGLLDLGFGNVLLDVSPGVAFVGVGFDATGRLDIPLVLNQPTWAAASFYVQGVELGGTLQLSNGLHLLTCP